MAQVKLSRVSKRFGNTVAVDRLDLDLASGSLSTLLGPSGCGKTTTLRLIAGLEHPSAGRIDIGEKCVFGDGGTVLAEHRGIGMVFQSYAVWPHLTVFENVAYPLRIRHLPRDEIGRRVGEALHKVRLDHLRDRWPAQLSGGQQQRVALARAIVAEPRLLLLDEPLSNLDSRLRDQLGAEIRQLQQQLGLTAVYVTHDQQEALALSDFIAVMDGGRVLQSGPPREIFEKPNSRFVAEFLGWTNFLPAELLADGGIRLFGTRMPCDASAANIRIGPLFATIRPDRVALTPITSHAEAQHPLVGHVKKVTYHGTYSLCELSVHGQALLASLAPETAPAVESTVAITFEPSALRVVPDDPAGDRGPAPPRSPST